MMRRYRRELSVAGAYVLLLAVLLWRAPRFYLSGEFGDVMVANAPVLVAAVGMSLVILARQIDISIGAQLSVCVIAAGLMSRAGWPMAAVVVATLLLGGALGAVNGGLVAFLDLPSIVATLATYTILLQWKKWRNEGAMIKDLGGDWQWFGLGQGWGRVALVVMAGVVFALFAWGLRYVAAGRAVYAVGSDAEAARLVGIRPRRVTFWVFVAMGVLVAGAGLLRGVILPHVDPKVGEGGFELQVIAAVVVGGVAISGGRGTLVGVLIGVALLGTIRSALVFLGTEAYWDRAIQGGIILAAVASDAAGRWGGFRVHGSGGATKGRSDAATKGKNE